MLRKVSGVAAGRDERGAVAVIVALTLTGVVVVAALVLDFGLARLDRQVDKSAADSAVTAGMRAADGGSDSIYSYRGVCAALEYLKRNLSPELDALAWGSCTPANFARPCVPADSSTHARFTGSANGYDVRIENPYVMDAGEFPEENLPTLAGDQGDPELQGCDHLAVIVTKTREPGFGSLATEEDISSTIRSVGRVAPSEENEAGIALLLLERNDCLALDASGVNANIRVEGYQDNPGLIHSDSLGNGADCGPSGNNVFNGNHLNGIVVTEAETGSPPLPGLISTRALSGEAGSVPAKASDPFPEVKVIPEGEPVGRELVSRELVDERYLGDSGRGVTGAVASARSIFTTVNATNAEGLGWKKIGCAPTPAALSAITSADKAFVDCPGASGFNQSNVTINAQTVMFNGFVSASNLKMPNANRVYVNGRGSNGVSASNLEMHDFGAATCAGSPGSTRARLVIRSGTLDSTGGLLQLCKTTVILMGGYDNACLPTTYGTAPLTGPCGGTAGNGLIKISGGASLDWTAPSLTSDRASQAMWDDLEDLALWTETYGTGPQFQMAGSGSMYLSGVFIAPNANPFTIKGGGVQNVKNSSYVVRKLSVNGNGTLLMKPNPNDVIAIPRLSGFGLVR